MRNEHDLDVISQAARVEAETVRSIAHDIAIHHCLAMTKTVRVFPMVTRVRFLRLKMMGETMMFFSQHA